MLDPKHSPKIKSLLRPRMLVSQTPNNYRRSVSSGILTNSGMDILRVSVVKTFKSAFTDNASKLHCTLTPLAISRTFYLNVVKTASLRKLHLYVFTFSIYPHPLSKISMIVYNNTWFFIIEAHIVILFISRST